MIANGGEAASIGASLRQNFAGFARTLRMNGFSFGLAEARDGLQLLDSPALRQPASLRQALRPLACATHADWQRFDEIFDAYWLGRGMRLRQRAATILKSAPGKGVLGTPGEQPRAEPPAGGPPGSLSAPDRVERGAEAGEAADGRGRRGGASRAERLATTDIRHIVSPEEVAQTHALAARLARAMRARLVRRDEARRHGRRLDLRRTIHRNVSHGGLPVDLVWRRRKRRPLRLVMLLDASGSMSQYVAFFLRFLHGVVDAFREAEAFIFHTRLVHVSAYLRDRDIARAVDRLSLMAQGIGGGTRIGESLATFNRWHAARVITSRSAVLIVSDGYDTGEPEMLGREMHRLRRRCRRIVWLNPLLGWEGYEPQARGMRAALPHIQLFAPAHNLESLAALEPYLRRI